MPDLAVSWSRVGPDILVTVVRSEPAELLDCRWASDAAWGDAGRSGLINLTDYDPPSDLSGWQGPGCPAMGTRHDPHLSFVDEDGDDRMTVGDMWVLRGIEHGEETNVVLYTMYWSVTQVYVFRWGLSEPSI